MSEENEKNQEKEPEKINWEEKAGEYLNGWKRAMADYANREKEIGKEREVLRGFFEEAMILEFLPVLDNLKKSVSPELVEGQAWLKGLEQIVKQFEETLKKFGVEKIDVLDKEFDAALCEAAERESEGNKVIKVVADGYKKGNRVIRPARVIVG